MALGLLVYYVDFMCLAEGYTLVPVRYEPITSPSGVLYCTTSPQSSLEINFVFRNMTHIFEQKKKQKKTGAETLQWINIKMIYSVTYNKMTIYIQTNYNYTNGFNQSTCITEKQHD